MQHRSRSLKSQGVFRPPRMLVASRYSTRWAVLWSMRHEVNRICYANRRQLSMSNREPPSTILQILKLLFSTYCHYALLLCDLAAYSEFGISYIFAGIVSCVSQLGNFFPFLRPVLLFEMTGHLPVSLCSFAISMLLFFPFVHLASGAAINPPALSFLASNQSNRRPNNLPVTGNLGVSPYNCANDPVWTSRGFNSADCQSALLRLALTETDRHGDRDFEFLGPLADPTSSLPKMSTPRRYISGELKPCYGGRWLDGISVLMRPM